MIRSTLVWNILAIFQRLSPGFTTYPMIPGIFLSRSVSKGSSATLRTVCSQTGFNTSTSAVI